MLWTRYALTSWLYVLYTEPLGTRRNFSIFLDVWIRGYLPAVSRFVISSLLAINADEHGENARAITEGSRFEDRPLVYQVVGLELFNQFWIYSIEISDNLR